MLSEKGKALGEQLANPMRVCDDVHARLANGLTVRQWYVGQAMTGVCLSRVLRQSQIPVGNLAQLAADLAVMIADVTLNRLAED